MPIKGHWDLIPNNQVALGKVASIKQHELSKIYEVIGPQTVTQRDMEFAAPWIVEESYKEEESNWNDVYVVVNERDIPMKSNVITSHVTYKIKVQEDNTLKLKSRICAHGNRDNDKDKVRKDSAAAQFPIIRLLAIISTLLGFKMACIDISAAYLQSGPCHREIYMRPSPEHKRARGTLWKLVKLPYGISEAGRQWHTTCELWLLSAEIGFERIIGVSQLFVKKFGDGSIRMLIAKVTDDFLIVEQQESLLTDIELKELRRVAGQLNWAGRAAIPTACFAEISKISPFETYKSPTKPISEAFVAGFTDASFNISASRNYGQNGFVAGIAFRQDKDCVTQFHVTDWNSSKQRRVCYSSFGAEILACAEGDDRTYSLCEAIRSILSTSGETQFEEDFIRTLKDFGIP
eukprot:IDg7062t1